MIHSSKLRKKIEFTELSRTLKEEQEQKDFKFLKESIESLDAKLSDGKGATENLEKLEEFLIRAENSGWFSKEHLGRYMVNLKRYKERYE